MIGASGLLVISITRATLEIMNKDDKENVLRTEPVIINDRVIYKLPQSRVLPDNMFYFLKKGRDWLWLRFSPKEENKIRVSLILADKKISEAIILNKKEKYDLATEAGFAAIDNLKYALELTKKIDEQQIFQKQMYTQISEAAKAYGEIVEEMGKNDKIDGQKYFSLLQKINEFKEKETQK